MDSDDSKMLPIPHNYVEIIGLQPTVKFARGNASMGFVFISSVEVNSSLPAIWTANP